MYKTKLEIKQLLINNSKYEENKKKLKFVNNPYSYLSQTYDIITNFLLLLRNDPEIIFKIVSKISTLDISIEQINSTFFTFLVDNFYENILSSNSIEDELLALIYRIVKLEINKLNDKSNLNTFFQKSTSNKIFKALINKNDIKEYINMILKDIIEYLENNSDNLLTFDLEEMKPKKSEISTISNDFLEKYIPDIDKETLLKEINSTENEYIKEYLQFQIDKMGDDINIYSNSKIVMKFYSEKEGQSLFVTFSRDFELVKRVVDKLFNKIIENIHLIPLSIKYICKIIYIVTKKKFPDMTIIESNILLGIFFFEKIVFPGFIDPDGIGLINSFFPNYTLENINIVKKVINQLIKLRLFSELGYTIFNWYFIKDIIPIVFKFYNELIDVNFPKYIDKLVNEEIADDDFFYNYFEENPTKNIYYQSIFFCIDDYLNIDRLINLSPPTFPINLDNINCKNEKLKQEILAKRKRMNLLYEKLINKSYSQKLTSLFIEEKFSNVKNYILLTQILYSDSFLIIKKLNSNPCYIREELKNDSNEINRIIKIQNFLSNLLYYYRTFNTLKFSDKIKTNTISILTELVKFVGTGSFVSSSSIPSEWYAQTLIQLLISLPEEYKENDFEKIYSQITENLIKSIQSLNSEYISQIYSDLDFTETTKTNLQYVKKCLIENSLNNIAKKFIEQENLDSSIYLEYDINLSNIRFHIINKKDKENDKLKNKLVKEKKNESKDNSKKKSECDSINDFINKFPSFSTYQLKTDIDLFTLYESNKIGDYFIKFFEDIKTLLPNLELNSIIIELLNTYNNYNNINNDLELKVKYNKKFNKDDINYDDLIEKIDENIEKYSDFLYIEEKIDKGKILAEIFRKLNNKLFYKIFGYIMLKLYDKLFPIAPDIEDINIFQNSVKLSWIQPNDLIKDKKYIFYDNFITDTSKLMYDFTKDKSIIKKIDSLQKIFQLINQNINFNSSNSKNDAGMDDILPIFQYVIIKSKPEQLNSNINYLDHFLYKEISFGYIGQQISTLKIAFEGLKNSKFLKDKENQKQ